MDLLIHLAVFACVLVLIFWLLRQVPIPEPVGLIIRVIIVIAAVVYLLRLIGLWVP